MSAGYGEAEDEPGARSFQDFRTGGAHSGFSGPNGSGNGFWSGNGGYNSGGGYPDGRLTGPGHQPGMAPPAAQSQGMVDGYDWGSREAAGAVRQLQSLGAQVRLMCRLIVCFVYNWACRLGLAVGTEVRHRQTSKVDA